MGAGSWTPLWLGLVGAALLLVGVRMGAWLSRVRRVRENRRRQSLARRGERAAERVLRRHGYIVTGRQATTLVDMMVDGEPIEAELRADFLVERDGLTYVAEVKTGDIAPSPHAPATRRQLLEYSLAYHVHGTLLVDMETGRIQEIAFPIAADAPMAPRRAAHDWLSAAFLWMLAGAGLLHWLTRG